MDILKYPEKREKDLVTLIPTGEFISMISRQFDVESGKEIAPEILSLNPEELQKQREALVEQIKVVDILLADIKATFSKKPE